MGQHHRAKLGPAGRAQLVSVVNAGASLNGRGQDECRAGDRAPRSESIRPVLRMKVKWRERFLREILSVVRVTDDAKSRIRDF